MNKPLLAVVSMVIAVGAVAFYLAASSGGDGGTVLENPTPSRIAELFAQGDDHAAPDVRMVDGVKEIVVHASEYRFNPRRIDLEEGERVRLVMINHGVIEHDLEVVGLTKGEPGHEGDVADEADVGHDEGSADVHAEDAVEDEGHVEDDAGVHAEDAHGEPDGHVEADAGDEAGDGHEHAADTISVHALAGETATVEFVVARAGQYAFVCTLPEHKELGMFGELVVMAGGHEEVME